MRMIQKRSGLIGFVILALSSTPRTAAARAGDGRSLDGLTDIPLLRVFLREGGSLVAVGEFGRLDRQVVFLMAGSTTENPFLRLAGWRDRRSRYCVTSRAAIAVPATIRRVSQTLSIIGLSCLAWLWPSLGSGEERLIDTQRSIITVHVFKAGVFRALGDNHLIRAPLLEGSIDTPPHIQLIVDARRMQVVDPGLSPKDRQDVRTRMLGPDVLDVDRFEQIRFHSLQIQPLDSMGWRVDGELELHGQIRPVTFTVILEDGHYKGSTSLMQSTFGITPITLVGGTVKVKDAVQVDFDIVPAER
jgi:hypothetical protein